MLPLVRALILTVPMVLALEGPVAADEVTAVGGCVYEGHVGPPIEGAVLLFESEETGLVVTVMSGPTGRYRDELAPGGYYAWVSAPGYVTYVTLPPGKGIVRRGEVGTWNFFLERTR